MSEKKDDLKSETKKTVFKKNDEASRGGFGQIPSPPSSSPAKGEGKKVPDLDDSELNSNPEKKSQSQPASKSSESPAPVVAKVPSKEKGEAEEMEVMSNDQDESTALSHPAESTKAVSKWAFWKRPSRRDEQLARISDGYVEMVDLVRAISGQLESQNENNMILRDSLAHLPQAMKGLDSFSKSQHIVGEALQEIHGQLQRTSSRDEKLLDSMDGFNSTLQGLDVTNRATMQTFDRVQERMSDSDTRMENLFENVQESEGKVSDTMLKLQKNMAIMQGIFLCCLLVVIGVLVYFVMKEADGSQAPAPNPIVEPVTSESVPSGVTPREAREVVVPALD